MIHYKRGNYLLFSLLCKENFDVSVKTVAVLFSPLSITKSDVKLVRILKSFKTFTNTNNPSKNHI